MRKALTFICIVLFLKVNLCFAQQLETQRLIIGTKQAAPFSIKTSDGIWRGISIDLWKRISQELDLEYEFREYDLKGLLQAVKDGSIDAGVAALTITSQREIDFDFSHPFYVDGLGIAVSAKGQRSFLGAFRKFFSYEFLKVIGALALVLLIFGILVWFFERKRNPNQFGGRSLQGIGSGFWWSAVTMTTVGYGDKTPITPGGRLVALIWMFTAIIIISSFTAAITSTLTVSQLEIGISGPEDLDNARVGTIPNSTSEHYLQARKLSYQSYKTLKAGLDALHKEKLDAFVYDAPILQYIINKEYQREIKVLPNRFEDQHYGLAFPSESPLRERVNRVLLKAISEESWNDILSLYLGRQ